MIILRCIVGVKCEDGKSINLTQERVYGRNFVLATLNILIMLLEIRFNKYNMQISKLLF